MKFVHFADRLVPDDFQECANEMDKSTCNIFYWTPEYQEMNYLIKANSLLECENFCMWDSVN